MLPRMIALEQHPTARQHRQNNKTTAFERRRRLGRRDRRGGRREERGGRGGRSGHQHGFCGEARRSQGRVGSHGRVEPVLDGGRKCRRRRRARRGSGRHCRHVRGSSALRQGHRIVDLGVDVL